jgi:hypothetical protein
VSNPIIRKTEGISNKKKYEKDFMLRMFVKRDEINFELFSKDRLNFMEVFSMES